MLEKVEVLCHSCIKISKDKIIYFDPFNIKENINDADIIFITHNHYDHFSEQDIEKVKKNNTKIVITQDLKEKAYISGFDDKDILIVNPDNEYKIEGIKLKTVPAYNTNKHFHPKENNWVGYIIELEGKRYYIAGDTDATEDNRKVECDVAFVPVGGTYTMTAKEAAELINEIKPKVAVPIHYGSIVGEKKDGEEFIELLNSGIKGKLLI